MSANIDNEQIGSWAWLRGVIAGLPVHDIQIAGCPVQFVQLTAVMNWIDEGARRADVAAAPAATQQVQDAQPVADERAAFTAWAEVEYRHAKQYDVRDYTLGLTAWQARAALAAPQPAAAPQPVSGADELPAYVIYTRPGMVPERKGPYPTKAVIEAALRELQAAHPDATSMVIRLPSDCYPQSGVEWIDMHGDRRRGRLLAAQPSGQPSGEPAVVRNAALDDAASIVSGEIGLARRNSAPAAVLALESCVDRINALKSQPSGQAQQDGGAQHG